MVYGLKNNPYVMIAIAKCSLLIMNISFVNCGWEKKLTLVIHCYLFRVSQQFFSIINDLFLYKCNSYLCM